MLKPDRGVDGLVGELAARQHGVVARWQLMEAGLGRRVVEHRLSTGRLYVVHRGVYAVGHPVLSGDGRWRAATLAAGPGAVLSHRAAGAAWLLLRSTFLEVTAATVRRHPGIRSHRRALPEDEVTGVRGIPVTTVPRTLFDLAAVLPRHQLERAINEAELRGLRDRLSLPELLERYPRRRGAPVLRAILDGGAVLTRSELEARFLAFAEKARLPRPEANAWLLIAGRWIECDCVWRERRVIVELDGRAAHGTAAAFERDRARDRMLQARGWRLVRVTWRQLHEEPEALAYDLRAILSSARGTAPSRRTSQRPSSS